MEEIRNEAMDYRSDVEAIEMEPKKKGKAKKIIGGVVAGAATVAAGFAATKLFKRNHNDDDVFGGNDLPDWPVDDAPEDTEASDE